MAAQDPNIRTRYAFPCSECVTFRKPIVAEVLPGVEVQISSYGKLETQITSGVYPGRNVEKRVDTVPAAP